MENDQSEKIWLEEILIPKILSKIVKLDENEIKAIDSKITIENITIKYLGSDEAFMLTNCYRTTIAFNFNGKLYTQHLVVKKTPPIPVDAYDSVNFDTLFFNEITAYIEIIPALALTLQKSILKYPEYFYSERKRCEACMVLGDFGINGWQLTTSKVNLSLEHIMLAVENLAIFHGSAYAFKMNDSKKFTKLIGKLRESRYATLPDQKWALFLKYSVHRAYRSAKSYHSGKIPLDFYEKLVILLDDTYQYGKKRLLPVEPFATLCHGDYLRNNIAFKYCQEQDMNTTPTDVMMFDFQTLRYASPMMDLVTFMSLSTGHQIRHENFDQIFKCYLDNVTKVIQEITHISEIPEFFSYDSMLAEYIRYLPYGLGVASAFLMSLYDPKKITAEELLIGVETVEETMLDINTRGGEIVDKELAELVYDLYNFSVKQNVDIFESI